MVETPLDDESLSSWLSRQMFYAAYSSERDVSRVSHYWKSRVQAGDIDYDCAQSDIAEYQQHEHSSVQDFIKATKLESRFLLLTVGQRISFCLLCAYKDLKLHRVPVWRKSWSFGWYTVCDEHRLPLDSLRGPYSCLELSSRNACLSKYLVDTAHGVLLKNIRSRVTQRIDDDLSNSRPDRLTQARHCITALAYAMQSKIVGLLSAAGGESKADLVLIGDLYCLLLRRYERGIDVKPYVYQIAEKFCGLLSVPTQPAGTPYDTLLVGAAENLQVFPRLVTFAVIAFLLEDQAHTQVWSLLVEAMAAEGVLIPNTSSWLFATCTGIADNHSRDWFSQKVAEYPTKVQSQCFKFMQI